MTREAPMQLEGLFQAAKTTPSDINEHLDLLRAIASRCEHVTEFGLRGGSSTLALLAAQPAEFVSWDINPMSVVSQPVLNMIQLAGRTKFQPRCGDTLKVITEETDFLFVDTLHTAKQLKLELERHCFLPARRVKKWIAFHDTMTFGLAGEDGTEPGLRAVIKYFQQNNWPHWKVIVDRENNNGLVVLEHASVVDEFPPEI